MLAPHPYRSPERCAEAPPAEPLDALRGAQLTAKVFLLGWSLVRVAVCAVRGLDLEGCAAVVIVVAAVRTLANDWSRFS